MGNLVLKNIDKIVSGDIMKGILPGDAIVVRDGLIAQIGYLKDLDTSGIDRDDAAPISPSAARNTSAHCTPSSASAELMPPTTSRMTPIVVLPTAT